METIYHPLCDEIQPQVLHHELTESPFVHDKEIFNAQHHVNMECAPHFHTHAEIMVILDGTIETTIGQNTQLLQAGDCVFVIPYESHYYRTILHADSILFAFQPTLIEHFDALIGKVKPACPMFHMDTPTLEFVKSRLPLLDDSFSKLDAQALVYPILSALMRGNAQKAQESEINYSLMNKILLYIENNCEQELTLQTLSKEFGLSPQCLGRMLRAHLGIRYTSYLNNVRLTKAIPILKYTDKSITEIAYECGFGSVRNFNRIFSDYMKKTPSQFRKDRETYYAI